MSGNDGEVLKIATRNLLPDWLGCLVGAPELEARHSHFYERISYYFLASSLRLQHHFWTKHLACTQLLGQ